MRPAGPQSRFHKASAVGWLLRRQTRLNSCGSWQRAGRLTSLIQQHWKISIYMFSVRTVRTSSPLPAKNLIQKVQTLTTVNRKAGQFSWFVQAIYPKFFDVTICPNVSVAVVGKRGEH